jgi:hypothetical protein
MQFITIIPFGVKHENFKLWHSQSGFPVKGLPYRNIYGPHLWPSGDTSWLQNQRSGFDSRCYKIFWEVVSLEWGPLILFSTIEELLRRKKSCSCLENRKYGLRHPSRWPRDTLYPQELILTSLKSGGRSVHIFCSRTQATEFIYIYTWLL